MGNTEMKEKNTNLPSPQLVNEDRIAVALAHKQIVSLYKKSEQSGIPFDTLKEVYQRGYALSSSEQVAFNRVNSFIAGGKAADMDEDLLEKRGLWDNIWAKRNRIKHGSGEHMRKPGSKGAPTEKNLKDSQTKNESINAEKISSNPIKPSNRFVATTSLTNNYKKSTPGYTGTIKRVAVESIKELAVRDVSGKMIPIKKELSRGINMKLHKTYPGKSSSSGGGGGGGSGSGGGSD